MAAEQQHAHVPPLLIHQLTAVAAGHSSSSSSGSSGGSSNRLAKAVTSMQENVRRSVSVVKQRKRSQGQCIQLAAAGATQGLATVSVDCAAVEQQAGSCCCESRCCSAVLAPKA
jgi:hypothetical protein